MNAAKRVSEISQDEFDGRIVALHGLLLGKGNRIDGGRAWIVDNHDSRNLAHCRIEIVPSAYFKDLLGSLPAFGGGEHVLAYEVNARGRFIDGTRSYKPIEIIADVHGRRVTFDFSGESTEVSGNLW